jgi:Holliday junction resolvase RusA-like endonuclease
MTVTIPNWHPKRLNELIGCHWAAAGRKKKADRNLVWAYTRKVPKAKLPRRVTLTLTMAPRQRRGDGDAYWKSLLDALVHCGLLVDDGPKWCELAPVRYVRGPAMATEIGLEDLAPPATARRAG